MQRKSILPQTKISGVASPGTLAMWTGTVSNIPDGWLIANGAAIGRSDYPELFAVLGGQYGYTSTTFNIPNFLDGTYKFPSFNTVAGTKEYSSLPNIVGVSGVYQQVQTTSYSGALYNSAAGWWGSVGTTPVGMGNGCFWLGFDASRSCGVYGRLGTNDVVPNNTSVIPIIKY